MTGFSQEEILEIYRRYDAVWFYDYNGRPTAPHVELTSGSCSDGYINSSLVISDPAACGFLASELAKPIKSMGIEPAWIVGSAYAAITFSYELARVMGARHGFVEKDPADPKRMHWPRLTIPRDVPIFQCEELITTLQTTREVRYAITAENRELPVQFLPYVVTVIYRPPSKGLIGSIEVIKLAEHVIRTWQPKYCPLCAAGSPRFRPKEHWAELTGKS